MHPRGIFSYQGCDVEVCYNQRRHACKASSTRRRCRASATTARRSCIDNKNCYDQPVLLLEPVERPRRRRGGAASITKIATSNIYFCWNRSGVDDDSEAKLHPRQKLLRPTSIFAGTSRATERRSCIHNKFCYDGLMFLLEPA